MSTNTLTWLDQQSKDTSKGKDCVKLNPLTFKAVEGYAPGWEPKPCYILTQGGMWPFNLDRRSLLGYNTLYETLIVPTSEGEAKLRRWRSNPTWCEDSFGSYKNLYVLNNDTRSIVIEYVSGKVVIVQGNKHGGPIIQGDIQSPSVPPGFTPLPSETFKPKLDRSLWFWHDHRLIEGRDRYYGQCFPYDQPKPIAPRAPRTGICTDFPGRWYILSTPDYLGYTWQWYGTDRWTKKLTKE